MYKVKIVFLYTDSKGQCTWSHQWADWDGTSDMQGVVAKHQKKEETALKKDNIDKEIKYVTVFDCNDVTDGKYLCNSCECYFDELDDEDCPYCGSGNFVESSIEEPEPKEFKGPRLYKL